MSLISLPALLINVNIVRLVFKIQTISNIELSELTELRERYIYNITPWTQVARKGLRLFYSDDETDDSDEDPNDDRTSEGAYGFLKAATKQGTSRYFHLILFAYLTDETHEVFMC